MLREDRANSVPELAPIAYEQQHDDSSLEGNIPIGTCGRILTHGKTSKARLLDMLAINFDITIRVEQKPNLTKRINQSVRFGY